MTAEVRINIDGIPYRGTAATLAAAILQLRDVLADYGAPVSDDLRRLFDLVFDRAMGDALRTALTAKDK